MSQGSSFPEHGQGNKRKIFHLLRYDYQRLLLFTECLNATQLTKEEGQIWLMIGSLDYHMEVSTGWYARFT